MMMMQVRYLAFAIRGMTEPWDHKRFPHVSDLIRYPVQLCSHLLGLALHCPPGCQLKRCNLSPNGQPLTFFQLLSPCGSSLVVPHHIKWDHLLTWVWLEVHPSQGQRASVLHPEMGACGQLLSPAPSTWAMSVAWGAPTRSRCGLLP